VTDPLSAVQQALEGHVLLNKDFRFIGGSVGYVSYDAVRYWEKLPRKTCDDTNFPDVQMGVFEDGIIFDHKQKTAYYYFLDKDQSEEIMHIKKSSADSETLSFNQPKVNVTKEHFEKSVEKAK